ncbi:DNA helicase loader [Erwinia phage vB_EamM-Bue1]|uniref:DNA helicase loader n=1 Tax=Erwinia phage vB_EamM-Bue1 TaxID=2099338 RepID=A0A2P1JU40_9CAUD|nr:DNA helicase loader [Erwinia phage vB_EamM-Bue1]AVO22871.1 DNA helicase loader [Erwinia phage vB_EamM-Bue1]
MSIRMDITEWQRLEFEQAFDVYCYYMAFKLHFSKRDFNYADYGPMVNFKFETFYANEGKRKQFARLARRFETLQREVLENYMIANFVQNPKVWVNGLITKQAQSNYDEWRKLYENFSYNFISAAEELLFPAIRESGQGFMGYFRPVSADTMTPFMNDVTRKRFPIWFVVALHKVTGFINTYDAIYKDDLIWQSESFLIRKTNDVVLDRDVEALKIRLKEAIIAQGL